MFVVTGANGKLGSAVVKNLLNFVPPLEIAASVRETKNAEELSAYGVEIRLGDYDRPETLERSFAGATRLLLISASGIEHEPRVARHRNAIHAAARAGVKHVFYTSLVHGDHSIADVVKAHIDTEGLLRESELPFTILQDGIYAEALDTYLGDYQKGDVVIPEDGPVAWVSRSDIAAAIARLMRDGGHQGQTLRLTGPAALTIGQLSEILGEVSGRSIKVRTVSLEEYVAYQAAGKSIEWARHWATTYFAMARGEFAVVDPLLRNLLGRPLLSVEEVLRQKVSRQR